MVGLIVFTVGENRYALNLDYVQRIIQSQVLTPIPNGNPLIDGMMSHEDKITKVLNFRKLIGSVSYEDELSTLFESLKNAHKGWVETLQHALKHGEPFTKTTDPHVCELGKWIDNFNSYDDKVSRSLKQLSQAHQKLHQTGGDILNKCSGNPQLALERFDAEISIFYNKTMESLEDFLADLHRVADSLQKLIIFEKGTKIFAIKVDTIEDIAHVEENTIMHSDEYEDSAYLELEGVLDLNGVLVNVIKTIDIPT